MLPSRRLLHRKRPRTRSAWRSLGRPARPPAEPRWPSPDSRGGRSLRSREAQGASPAAAAASVASEPPTAGRGRRPPCGRHVEGVGWLGRPRRSGRRSRALCSAPGRGSGWPWVMRFVVVGTRWRGRLRAAGGLRKAWGGTVTWVGWRVSREASALPSAPGPRPSAAASPPPGPPPSSAALTHLPAPCCSLPSLTRAPGLSGLFPNSQFYGSATDGCLRRAEICK